MNNKVLKKLLVDNGIPCSVRKGHRTQITIKKIIPMSTIENLIDKNTSRHMDEFSYTLKYNESIDFTELSSAINKEAENIIPDSEDYKYAMDNVEQYLVTLLNKNHSHKFILRDLTYLTDVTKVAYDTITSLRWSKLDQSRYLNKSDLQKKLYDKYFLNENNHHLSNESDIQAAIYDATHDGDYSYIDELECMAIQLVWAYEDESGNINEEPIKYDNDYFEKHLYIFKIFTDEGSFFVYHNDDEQTPATLKVKFLEENKEEEDEIEIPCINIADIVHAFECAVSNIYSSVNNDYLPSILSKTNFDNILDEVHDAIKDECKDKDIEYSEYN